MGIFRWLSALDRLEARIDALETRVQSLERERAALAIEHTERMNQLSSLYSRMSTRYQRTVEAKAKPSTSPEPPKGSDDVLTLRRSLGK